MWERLLSFQWVCWKTVSSPVTEGKLRVSPGNAACMGLRQRDCRALASLPAVYCYASTALFLRPLFAESVQSGFGQILGEHDRMKFHVGVEREEPRLSN